MKKIKLYMTISITLLMSTVCNAQNNFKTIPKEFEMLLGTWQGSLTYLDYSSGKPYTMPANLEVKKVNRTNKFIFSNIYPNEVSANSIDTIFVSTDGTYIDKELVKSNRTLRNGILKSLLKN